MDIIEKKQNKKMKLNTHNNGNNVQKIERNFVERFNKNKYL